MAKLTGDFDIVMQMGGPVFQRLAATMHQNHFRDDGMPSLPNVVHFRLDGSGSLSGERGAVSAQVGSPHIVLIDGATDRFWVEMGFRARYHADPGSQPLADVIHGTIRAMYRLDRVDSSCPGWAQLAEDYMWLRVVQSSVSFDGTTRNDLGETLLGEQPEHDHVVSHISQHLAKLLATQFQPSPHRMSAQFRRLITRTQGSSSGVAVPLSLDGGAPAGNLSSISQLFLAGNDFAVGVSSDYIVRRVQALANEINNRQVDTQYRHSDPAGHLDIDYSFRINGVSTQWLGALPWNIPGAMVKISAAGVGWASWVSRGGVYNIGAGDAEDLRMTATIDQVLTVTFDVTREKLVVVAFGDPTVSIDYDGPFEDTVKDRARSAAQGTIKNELTAKLSAAQSGLDKLAIGARKDELANQLKTIDAKTSVRFTGASYSLDGIVMHGAVTLTNRYAPQVKFAHSRETDYFDAIEAWIPGGRVDSFEWTWHFYGNPVQKPAGPPGGRSQTDSYLLRRPRAARNRFGLAAGLNEPLPGIDGIGKVCLALTGVAVHPATGALATVKTAAECVTFGYQLKLPQEVGPYLRVCDPLRAAVDGRFPEVGVIRMSADTDVADTHNTLVLYLDDHQDDAAQEALAGGINSCERQFAGLLVVVLFREGTLSTTRDGLVEKITRLTEGLAAPSLIAEDTDEKWSTCFGFSAADAHPSWRLLSPQGANVWAHDGALAPDELAEALAGHLVASSAPFAVSVSDRIEIGDRLRIPLTNGDCPPIPVKRANGARVAFVDSGDASIDELRRLQDDQAQPPCVAVVVDGVSARELQRWGRRHDVRIPLIADPTGLLTRRAGIRMTPSVLTLDPSGRRAPSADRRSDGPVHLDQQRQ